MVTSWHEKVKQFKSPVRVVSAFLLRSRETLATKNQQLQQESEEVREQLKQKSQQLRQQQQSTATSQERLTQLERQLDEASQSVNLPEDRSLATHGYGARMISLAVNLARSVGLRAAERVLQLFFDWLGIEQNTPTRTSIRNWLQRLGIAEMQQPLKSNEDLVILVDHSNQIGTEQ